MLSKYKIKDKAAGANDHQFVRGRVVALTDDQLTDDDAAILHANGHPNLELVEVKTALKKQNDN